MAPEGKKRNTPHTETSSPKKRRCNDDGSVEFARSNADFWINEAIRTARLIDKLTADKKNAIEKAGEWEAETTVIPHINTMRNFLDTIYEISYERKRLTRSVPISLRRSDPPGTRSWVGSTMLMVLDLERLEAFGIWDRVGGGNA